MKISVTNIGPVRKAEIELAPLTVFIGPNNTGKSLVATVLYSAFSQTGSNSPRGPEFFADSNLYNGPQGRAFEEFAAFLAQRRTKNKLHYNDLPDSYKEFLNTSVSAFLIGYMENVAQELRDAIGSPLRELRRTVGNRSSTASITLESENQSWSGTIALGSRKNDVTIDQHPNIADLWESVQNQSSPFADDDEYLSIHGYIGAHLQSALLKDMPRDTKYLPAARSGILHSYRRMTSQLIRQARIHGPGSSRGQDTPGIIVDFIAELAGLSPRLRGEFAVEADRLEQEIINGQIVLIDQRIPEPVYRSQGRDYPIARMSSMVSELTPVILYVRSGLEPGDLLIIDEPEAHLHPAAQVAFARCLVRLVNRGLKICLTTHSEYFLEQINSTIIAAQLPKEKITGLLELEEQLISDNVAAYFFDAKDSGTNVLRLPVNPEEGIPNLGFDAVTERQYNDLAAMNRWINEQKED